MFTEWSDYIWCLEHGHYGRTCSLRCNQQELLGATLGAGKTEFLRAVHLYVSGEMWRPSGSRRTIIQWKKGEEENVIDFLTVIFTRCARSDSRA